MEKILAIAQDLVVELKASLAKVKARESELNIKEQNLISDRKALDEKVIEIAGREAECKKVENVVELMRSAKELKNEADSLMSKARGEMEKATNASANANAEIALEKQKIREDKISLANSWKQLRDEEKSLEQKKKEYKDEVLNAIKAKVG